jgi:hypothetical protein
MQTGNQKDYLQSFAQIKQVIGQNHKDTPIPSTGNRLDSIVYNRNVSNRSHKTSPEKHLPKRCTTAQLEQGLTGDHITNADGIKGVVAEVHISQKRSEKHYYLKLKHGITLLFIT